MNNRINIVSKLGFVRLDAVTSYQDNFNGSVTLVSDGWKTIPMYEGSVRMMVSETKTSNGARFATDITGRLKDLITVRCSGILAVTMCDGQIYIVGTPDLPVSIDITSSLTQKTFQIKHFNTVFPYIKAV